MLQAFKEINLHMFVELGKLKKPSKVTFQTAKMICMLVNSMRDRSTRLDVDELDQWSGIQRFMNANINQYVAEVLSLKNRLQDLDSFGPEVFIMIRDQFFPEGAPTY